MTPSAWLWAELLVPAVLLMDSGLTPVVSPRRTDLLPSTHQAQSSASMPVITALVCVLQAQLVQARRLVAALTAANLQLEDQLRLSRKTHAPCEVCIFRQD
jgi:hypothetical protein